MSIEITFSRMYCQNPWIEFWGYLYEDDLPGYFDVRTWGSATAMFKNTGSAPITLDATVEFIDPDEQSRAKYTRSLTLNPGYGEGITTANGELIMFDKAGHWYFKGSATGVQQAWHVLVIEQQVSPYKCPYCDPPQYFDTEEELLQHIQDRHVDDPPNGEPSEGLLKWVLIGGGIILVSAFVIRPLIRRK